jgi:DNA polymerase III epsilon subunit-like protein
MDRVIEIGAVRVRLEEDGSATLGERFSTFVDPSLGVGAAITRLTGIRDEDLTGAPALGSVIGRIASFIAGAPVVGHNVGFDLAFLERVALGPFERLDTAELASILMPSAPTYALQALAADAGIRPESAHRALDDALTCAAVLADLGRRARELPVAVLEEVQAYAPLLGSAYAAFFAGALRGAVRGAWDPSRLATPPAPRPSGVAGASVTVAGVFSTDGPLARRLAGYEDRPQQRALAAAIEDTFRDGGALLAEAGTGVGKSLAYLVPAVGRALGGERVIVSTHTLPLQDQLVRKDLPALQAALGSTVEIAVLKGRSNYLCPRRWQSFRGLVATRDEARLLLKTLVWRTTTSSGDRAELNLLGSEADLWGRVSADDETCDARRCARVAGGC